ncbi:hypothetical protein YWIDRAFT_07202, partial [Streptomyces sp. SceaMP-e96]
PRRLLHYRPSRPAAATPSATTASPRLHHPSVCSLTHPVASLARRAVTRHAVTRRAVTALAATEVLVRQPPRRVCRLPVRVPQEATGPPVRLQGSAIQRFRPPLPLPERGESLTRARR